jgi:DNA-directed RNA polymerase subunit RPC12/RpoP
MHDIGVEKVQLGQSGLLTGILRNLIAGSLEVEIYICSECGKVEFYSTHGYGDDELPQKTCPQCGSTHDIDFPRCPNCNYKYENT